ncbi:MAG: phytanoyl-CoA dioxygenase family protein [Lentisphaeria bacterium]|nr:phytanoyl-CoA dioxygenase family protein [Lentisphaeria bacterium]NQZ70326.1 phytanoyl-CoA dioxygenase family protein [Lentisphaeria bacterium]
MPTKEDIINTVKETGACCIPDFLSESELQEAREDLDKACADMGFGDQKSGERARLDSPDLLSYPGIERIFNHPETKELAAMFTGDEDPFVQEVVANRYYPPFPPLDPHMDENFGLVPPFMRLTWALFLDDTTAESGALCYVPGSHLRNYVDDAEADKQPPTDDEVEHADYVPIPLTAGTLVLRASDVWHSVKPINHLRRYLTGSYISRTRLTPWFKKDIERIITERAAQ